MLFDFDARARPVVKWVGGKSGPLKQLIEQFPSEFKTYWEPFVGGGAVFLALKVGTPAVINDTNSEIIDLYEVIRDTPELLTQALDVLASEYSEEKYYLLRSEVPIDKVAKAARTVFLNKTGFNGLYRLNSKGLFNVPFGKRTSCPELYDIENLQRVSQRLKNALLCRVDFEAVIDRAQPGDFVYCDPPYEPLSRTSAFTSYTAGGFSQDEQARLEKACAAAVRRGVCVAVSNSTAPFILSLYEKWNVRQVLAKRAINSKGTGRGEIAEVLAIGRHTIRPQDIETHSLNS